MQFISVSGGLVGGSDPPAFQRAEKDRMEKEKTAREENEGGISSLNHDEQQNVSLVFSYQACSILLWWNLMLEYFSVGSPRENQSTPV